MYMGDPNQPAQPYQPPPPVYDQTAPPVYNQTAPPVYTQPTPPAYQPPQPYYSAYPQPAMNPNQPMAQPLMPVAVIIAISDDTPPLITSSPQYFECPKCEATTMSKVTHQVGAGTWVCCFFIAGMGGFLGCCLLPFFNQSCQNNHHFCGKCNAPLGSRLFLCNQETYSNFMFNSPKELLRVFMTCLLYTSPSPRDQA
eukprot:TRINITY_DN618_c0_g1_i7.p2 TRINITY_DN618_c0_g1~~TRINITY_DN618_c0_g1_i7.p2  ORF type:complete len:197 (+),score=33.49 TRINITY_DN618_c0_g1_i7:171-761(+)